MAGRPRSVRFTSLPNLLSDPRTVRAAGNWCNECGYELRGLPDGHPCPECGHTRDEDEKLISPVTAWSRVVFAGVNKYGRPPLQVAHGGGAYISQTIPHDSADRKELLDINRRLIKAMRMQTGATHAEFIKSETDGNFYFLEIASRVGGAYIADVLEAASGINLWHEWAKLEVSDSARRAGLKPRKEHAGIILSLARQEFPDTSAYVDPEIVYRAKKKHHAGLIVRSANYERVTELLDDYSRRFAEDFIAVLPPLERPE